MGEEQLPKHGNHKAMLRPLGTTGLFRKRSKDNRIHGQQEKWGSIRRKYNWDMTCCQISHRDSCASTDIHNSKGSSLWICDLSAAKVYPHTR